jgi:hypothetical protein
MDLDTILDRLGGKATVAAALGCGRSAFSNWKTRGISQSGKFQILSLAEQLGVPLTISDIERVDSRIRSSGEEAA